MWTFLAHDALFDLLRRALGFSVLQFWLFFRSFFRFLCQKTSVFRFWCSLRFADFSFLSILFSVFAKILAVLRFWYPMWFLVFPILSYLGPGFSSI